MPDAVDSLPRADAGVVKRARLELESALGSRVISDPDLLESYATDWSSAGRYLPDLVVRAESSRDISRVLEVASRHRIPVTPRGLGSGKAGGALPVCGGVVLSTERMARIREIDRDNMVAVVEPGVVTGDLMRQVEEEGLFYPPDPNSLAICSIGGNVACNAGGPRALKYGVTRHYVLGLDVVLPSGEVVSTGRRTLKRVAGYDLTGLIVGSEGTLAVIAEITLKLLPKPRALSTALVTFPDLRRAAAAVAALLAAGVTPRTLELLDHHALKAVHARLPGRFPDGAGALVILETDGPSEDRAFADLEEAASRCLDRGALDVLVAQDEAQRARIWEPRRILSVMLTESAPRKISEDVVVPRARIPDFLGLVDAIASERELRVATYGHIGDGNLHVNVLFDEDQGARAAQAVRQIMETAVNLGGTISGEHGIGVCKREFMHLDQGQAAIDLQQQIKRAIDPQNILNPGKIFPSRGPTE